MATVEISTYLDAPPDRVWDEVSRPRLLQHVAHPMLSFTPVDPPQFADRFADGPQVVTLRWRGLIPLGRQVIDISRPPAEGETRFIRDNGHSALIRKWDHLVSIGPEGTGTRYTDRVEIDAGLLTPVVASFARRFYQHRQTRWRALVASDFDYSAA